MHLADVGQAAPVHAAVEEAVAAVRQAPEVGPEGDLADLIEELNSPEGDAAERDRQGEP